MGKTGFVLFLICTLCLAFTDFPVVVVQGQTSDIFDVQVAFPNLMFNQPVGLFSAPDNTGRLFVIEQHGVIRVFDDSPNVTSSTVFLDISSQVLYGGEQGLLGLAFHPNFTSNGYFYVDYVTPNPTRTIIARYTAGANQADPNSQFILLTINQPFSNHKGGQLAFGPDGYLYIGMGDGGGQGDPQGNGQNRATLLGKILRIDVNNPSNGLNYSIPPDNPFVGNTEGYRQESYAWGLRNPWRFSFDSVTGQLWVGDVGQNQIEEIDVVQKGLNYGWNIMEGTLPYAGGDTSGLQPPVYEYNHTLGNAIIGGYVYRGPTLPQLAGQYIYGDLSSGRIWALTPNGTEPTTVNVELCRSTLTISSFGVNSAGELYICALNDGKIYQLTTQVIPEFTASITFKVLAGLLIVGSMLAIQNKLKQQIRQSR